MASENNRGTQFKAPRYIKSAYERARWEASAANRYRLKVGDKPKMVMNQDHGMSYEPQDPHIQCEYCSAAFHKMGDASLHHQFEHPELSAPDHIRDYDQKR